MRILLVEDEKRSSPFLRIGLKAESFNVDMAHDSESVLHLAFVDPHNLIIRDRMRRVIPELVRNIRKENWKTPIIVHTAGDAVGEKVVDFEACADDHFVKPFFLHG